MSDFDQVCGRLHNLIRACMPDSHAYKVAVPFRSKTVLLFQLSMSWMVSLRGVRQASMRARNMRGK